MHVCKHSVEHHITIIHPSGRYHVKCINTQPSISIMDAPIHNRAALPPSIYSSSVPLLHASPCLCFTHLYVATYHLSVILHASVHSSCICSFFMCFFLSCHASMLSVMSCRVSILFSVSCVCFVEVISACDMALCIGGMRAGEANRQETAE